MDTVHFCILILGGVAALGLATDADCPAMAAYFCDNHISDNLTFCGSDGKHYPFMCAIWTVSCTHNVTITGTGPDCDPYPPAVTTTTEPPLPPFTRELYNAVIHGIDDRLKRSRQTGTPVEKAKLIFSKLDHNNKVYIRNKDCWVYDLDLTCMSLWNSDHGIRKAGTLVSPRHVVWTRQNDIPVNTTIRFVDANNIVYDRKIVGSRSVDSNVDARSGWDIIVGVLDQDVPSTIGFARVFPRSLTTFSRLRSQHLPTFSADFKEHALVDVLYSISNTYAPFSPVVLLEPSKTSLRHQFFEPSFIAYSEEPTFFVIKNDLVLLFVYATGGAGGGTPIVQCYGEINRIMEELGGGYRLTDVNLQGFLHNGETIPSILG